MVKRSRRTRADDPADSEDPAPTLPLPSRPAASSEPVIVGVGASAGGLEAFSQLLRSLPSEPNLALVLVQHLDPRHESSLAALLASTTPLPVTNISGGETKIEASHVYVIPPNRSLILRRGKLVLQPRPQDRSQYTPVNTFFRSLADELREDAVGVILSGTGSDGVEGIHAIKGAGGTILVQDPETAKQDGMLRAALATGKVDLVGSPPELAVELGSLAAARAAAGDDAPPGPQIEIEPRQLEQMFKLLRGATGVDFSQYKQPTIFRRIQRRVALHKLKSVGDYVKLLKENPAEVHQLYQDVLIHVTRFFREPESFEVLAREVFPALLEARRDDAPLRIWVPACSTGEEPYSVAMTLLECLDERHENVSIQIFATDVSETAIEHARTGVFPVSIADDLTPERLQRFVTHTDGHYRINKSIRDLCVFARQDLTRDPPFSKLDLIVCRNVLIYLSQAVQSRLINVFHYALKSTGFLVLGSAETIGSHNDLFSVTDKKLRVFRKKPVDTPHERWIAAPFTLPTASRPARRGDDPFAGTSAAAEATRLLLDRYSPPGVLVNEDLRIVQFRGQTGRFLEPAPGDASLNLLKMCREGLLHGLRTAIQNAKKQDGPVRREGLKVKHNGDFVHVTVEVVPLNPPGEGRHYLILFRDIGVPLPPPQLKVHRGGKAARPRVAEIEAENERLQKELVASREYLQSIIQDLEATNEELQSANEEILSSNEELQSTNEELDTAKEELQSTNEELNTVNEELHGRNEELARINSDLVNLLHGVQIAIVIVSRDLRIRRFTPMAERLLNLIPGDVGRPIGQIKPNLDCPDLAPLILKAIDTMSIEQRDVRDLQGRVHSLTIRPYKNVDNRIDGAVLALFDIDDSRRTETIAREARESREFADAILVAVRHPLVVLNGNLEILRTNPAFCQLFSVNPSQVEGRKLYELDGEAWQSPELRQALDQALTSNMNNFDVTHSFPGLGRKTVRLTSRRIEGEGPRPALILLELAD
jgi:two-component system CheB/CheR fusion protein